MEINSACLLKAKTALKPIFRSAPAAVICLIPSAVSADIVPDATLPETSIVPDGCIECTITGGTLNGSNLFHSFEEFSIPGGGDAYFNNALTVENIISRITGNNLSDINGVVRANGNANLFLINPNGFIFGDQASLNIGGSFLATTAPSLLFADGIQFSAENATVEGTLLTISTPTGLQFGSADPGSIINRSSASPEGAINSLGAELGLGPLAPVGLQVAPGKTLALVGGEVRLEGGNLTSPGGRIELAGLGNNSQVTLNSDELGWSFDYNSVENFLDISLSQFSQIDTSDVDLVGLFNGASGPINLRGRTIALQEGSQIFGLNFGPVAGAPISLHSSDTVLLDGLDVMTNEVSSIYSLAFGPSNAADIEIETGSLFVTNEATLGTATLFPNGGDTGNVTILARESVDILGSLFPAGIFVQVVPGATGNGGALTVETARLNIQDGSQIAATTFGEGNAGTVDVLATESINIQGGLPESASGIVSQSEEGASGNAGAITIETRQLSILDGAQIANSVLGDAQGNDLSVTADSILLSGFDPDVPILEQGRSGLFVAADPAYVTPEGEVVLTTGNSGNLIVEAQELIVEKGARISADTFGSGLGGGVTLNLDRLILREGGQIRAASLVEEDAPNQDRGAGGALTVNASELVEVSGTGTFGSSEIPSALLTLAEGTGAAGDIEINEASQADLQVIVTNGAEISASSVSSTGGNIFLNNPNVLLLRSGGRLTAEAGAAQGAGDGGNINLLLSDGFVIATPDENSDIVANAFSGTGGNINITAQNIIGLDERRATPGNTTNDIDASSQLGTSGSVVINNLDLDLTQGLIELPADTESSNQVAERCLIDREGQSAFVTTGQGGTQPTPRDILNNTIVELVDLGNGLSQRNGQTRDITQSPSTSVVAPASSITEAQGWQRNSQNEIVLVSQSSHFENLASLLHPQICDS